MITKTYLQLAKAGDLTIEEIIPQVEDMEVADLDGNNAMHHAVIGGHEPMVKLLLKYKIKVNNTNVKGETALHILMQSDYSLEVKKNIAQLLLKSNADFKIKNIKGEYPKDQSLLKSWLAEVKLDEEYIWVSKDMALIETPKVQTGILSWVYKQVEIIFPPTPPIKPKCSSHI